MSANRMIDLDELTRVHAPAHMSYRPEPASCSWCALIDELRAARRGTITVLASGPKSLPARCDLFGNPFDSACSTDITRDEDDEEHGEPGSRVCGRHRLEERERYGTLYAEPKIAPLRARLWEAVLAIWAHTVEHSRFVPGIGYTSRSDEAQLRCSDPDEHARLSLEEGTAYKEYREGIEIIRDMVRNHKVAGGTLT